MDLGNGPALLKPYGGGKRMRGSSPKKSCYKKSCWAGKQEASFSWGWELTPQALRLPGGDKLELIT